MSELCEGLKQCLALTKLALLLSDCAIEDQVFLVLSRTTGELNNLTHLFLQLSKNVINESIVDLGNNLNFNKKLRSINLIVGFNQISDKSKFGLCMALRNSDNLTEIRVAALCQRNANQQVQDQQKNIIQNNLKKCRKLIKLNLQI
ncbi:hypothetical protein ABPG72_006725 [Tetrahymena utriculariae]